MGKTHAMMQRFENGLISSPSHRTCASVAAWRLSRECTVDSKTSTLDASEASCLEGSVDALNFTARGR